MFYNIFYLFLLFFIYSMIGYITEIIVVSLNTKKLIFSRGFLIGPYIPIYGIGVICMVRLLSKYQNDLLALFVMSILVCTILEYITSLIMEKIFKLRWWDYSHKSFNINGRVCLTNSILFGVGGLAITKLINPVIENYLSKIPEYITIILGIVFTIIFIVDFIISIIAMLNIKIEVKKYSKKDATDIIKKEIAEFLKKHSFLRERITKLFDAFPNVKSLKNINFPDYKDLVQKIKVDIELSKQEYKKKQKQLKERITKPNK